MIRITLHILAIFLLTLLTQLGGIAWLVSLAFKRRLLAFLAIYCALSVTAIWVAPVFGRVPLACGSNGALHMQSKLYCVMNRHYVDPMLQQTLLDLAQDVTDEHPGTVTQILDANFPFFDGFALLPHLSHDDGRKADIAFYYRDKNGYVAGQTRSPIGYFAFEDGATECKDSWPTLRWDFRWAQRYWKDLGLEEERMRSALAWLSRDSRVEKLFIEPHLRDRIGVISEKIRFQGCRAARHDDHIHVQIRP